MDKGEIIPVKAQASTIVDDEQDKLALTKQAEDSLYIDDIKTESTSLQQILNSPETFMTLIQKLSLLGKGKKKRRKV